MNYDPYWIVTIVVITAIIILVICLIIFTSNRHLNQGLGEYCDNKNYICSNNTTCQNNVCLSNLGQYCQTLSNCVSGSTACYQETCTDVGLGTVNQSPPCQPTFVVQNNICKSPIGGFCQTLNDCVAEATQCTQVSGQLTCVTTISETNTNKTSGNNTNKASTNKNIYSLDNQILYPILAPYNVVDIAEKNNQIYILTSENIFWIRYIQNRQQLTTLEVENIPNLIQLISLGCEIYSIDSSGKVYQLKQNQWKLVDWIGTNVIFMDVTLDGVYLWIQTKDNMGYYYTLSADRPILLKSIKYNITKRRRHGRTINTYVDINNTDQSAIRYPKEDSYSNVYDALIYHNGEIIIRQQPGRIKLIRHQPVIIY